MRLRKKNTKVIRETKELPRTRKINIGKIIYFLFFVALVIFLVSKWGKGIIYIKGYGQIKISRLNVQEITDIRILKMMVEEGREVKKDEILFFFIRQPALPQINGTSTQLPSMLAERYRKIEDELKKLTFQLKKKLQEKKFAQEELKNLKEEQLRIKNLILLKTVTIDEVEKLEKAVEKIENHIALLNTEIAYLRNRIFYLRQVLRHPDGLKIRVRWRAFPDYLEVEFLGNQAFSWDIFKEGRTLELRVKSIFPEFVYDGKKDFLERVYSRKGVFRAKMKQNFKVKSCYSFRDPYRAVLYLKIGEKGFSRRKRINCQYLTGEVFRSPFSGMVTRIYFTDYEVALKGEKIMTIFRPGDIHIKGFFEQKDFKYLNTGDPVIIEFPDSSKFEGKIVRLYYAALPLPPEFQKKYEPVHRSIVADIVPVNLDLVRDREIEKMSVTLWVKKKLF